MATWDRRLSAAATRLDHPRPEARALPADPRPDGDAAGRPADLHADDAAALDALVRLARGRPAFSATVLARAGATSEGRLRQVTVDATPDGPRITVHEVGPETLALRDPLTGLPARPLVRERLVHAQAACVRTGASIAVLLVDIDGFHLLNEAIGHAAGDDVLRAVAARLGEALRPDDTLGRLQADEFVVIAGGLHHSADALALGERLRLAAGQGPGAPEPAGTAPAVADLSVSIGIAMGTADSDPDTLLVQAEHAVAQAKHTGRDRCQLFDTELRARNERRVAIDRELRRGLHDGTLEVHFQPIVEVQTRRVVGAEALMRVYTHDGTLLAPRELLAAANDNGLLRRVEAGVMRTACARAVEWHTADGAITVSVNLTERQFHDPHLHELVADSLAASALDPGRLMVEVNETTLAADLDLARSVVSELRATGVLVAIDGFCGSEAMIGHIDVLGIDMVKIDRGLVHSHTTPWGDTLLRSTMASLRSLAVPVTAVGIETEEQLDAMRAYGCTYAQGYLFTKAVPAASFPTMLGALDRA